jgi:hypothetical protein
LVQWFQSRRLKTDNTLFDTFVPLDSFVDGSLKMVCFFLVVHKYTKETRGSKVSKRVLSVLIFFSETTVPVATKMIGMFIG